MLCRGQTNSRQEKTKASRTLMSGKLIMKRKRADHHRIQQTEEQNGQSNHTVAEKRHRLEITSTGTPPTQQQSPSADNVDTNASNTILLEALQKIIELQKELDSFEDNINESQMSQLNAGEQEHLDDELAPPASRSEAEALGFAVCARETLQFLQNEGVSTESVLYKTLLQKLVGDSDGLLQA